MATQLTLAEIDATLLALERSLGTTAEVTGLRYADGRSVEKDPKTDPEKFARITYYKRLRAELTGEDRPRRHFNLAPVSGVE